MIVNIIIQIIVISIIMLIIMLIIKMIIKINAEITINTIADVFTFCQILLHLGVDFLIYYRYYIIVER